MCPSAVRLASRILIYVSPGRLQEERMHQSIPDWFPTSAALARDSPGSSSAANLKEWGTSSSIGHGLSKRMNFRAINDMSAVDDFDVHRCAPSSDWICAKSKVRMISRYSCTCTLACLPKTIYTLTRWQDLLKVIRRPYHPYHTYIIPISSLNNQSSLRITTLPQGSLRRPKESNTIQLSRPLELSSRTALAGEKAHQPPDMFQRGTMISAHSRFKICFGGMSLQNPQSISCILYNYS